MKFAKHIHAYRGRNSGLFNGLSSSGTLKKNLIFLTLRQGKKISKLSVCCSNFLTFFASWGVKNVGASGRLKAFFYLIKMCVIKMCVLANRFFPGFKQLCELSNSLLKHACSSLSNDIKTKRYLNRTKRLPALNCCATCYMRLMHDFKSYISISTVWNQNSV